MARSPLHNSTFYVMKRAGKAAFRFGMFGEEQPVLVALSGGAAGLVMLRSLAERRRRVPVKTPLVPAFVPDGVHGPPGEVADHLARWCGAFGLELVVASKPEPPSGAWDAVPHRDALLELALKAGAREVALGQTITACAMKVLVDMMVHGEISTLLPVEEVVRPGESTVKFVRPLYLVTSDNVAEVVAAERLPALPAQIPHPQQDVLETLDTFLRSKRGDLMERYKNIVSAPQNVNTEYMA